MKRVLLIGAGHAHVRLLTELAREPLYGARLTLVSPLARQIYSAMLPGVIAGHYPREAAEFDVERLAHFAHAEFVAASVTRLEPGGGIATLDSGQALRADIVLINAGSATGAPEHALSVKPFEQLVERLRFASHVAIAGGGAAGAELAMALRRRGGEVTLYSDRMPFPAPLAQRLARALKRNGVDFRPGMRVDAVEPGPLVVAGAARQQFDLVVWAGGAVALPWLAASGLAADERGFVRVDGALRSVSHPNVFVAGDCAAVAEPKSGVHAVRQGAVLAQNLRNLVAGMPLVTYEPRAKALLLLTCGSRYAIAARGTWSAEGRWAWWWKKAIDRRWLRRIRKPLGSRASR